MAVTELKYICAEPTSSTYLACKQGLASHSDALYGWAIVKKGQTTCWLVKPASQSPFGICSMLATSIYLCFYVGKVHSEGPIENLGVHFLLYERESGAQCSPDQLTVISIASVYGPYGSYHLIPYPASMIFPFTSTDTDTHMYCWAVEIRCLKR